MNLAGKEGGGEGGGAAYTGGLSGVGAKSQSRDRERQGEVPYWLARHHLDYKRSQMAGTPLCAMWA